ncbi:hypothetical protein WICMUC_003450 [Wickerhamomyces mucosus]|uniref:B-related factor 1 n=1 Tax=Wickerhamomyces mucosus TaxID=1378264 RepID=A0A9P8TCA1_9ASCO|nr:hypothetical protein WICMUC_003450 [Wickerhamomyces mucosus]
MSSIQRKCKGCGSTDFTRDIHSASSDLACQNCGRVFEENPIVSEVTFGETSNGAAVVQGAFIGADQAHATFGGGPRGNSMDSRTKTLASAKRKIRAVASALRIPEYVADAAYQWFSLALTNNFVKGRRSQNVISACLYIACRKEKTHHMLIDFSTRLQISLYSVGATFLKMVKALHITSLPLADPSLFIQHFAEKLEFGDDKVKIIKDAVRLAARMADDWIHEGRKPAGVAAACLLLAARMNNHRRTHSEIVAVAHVGEDTLQRRLNEFKSTNAGGLSVKQFREAKDIVRTAPPSFKRNRSIEEKMASKLNKSGIPNEFKQDADKDELIQRFINSVDLQSSEILEQLERVKRRQNQQLGRDILTKNLDVKVDGLELPSVSPVPHFESKASKYDENRPRNLHMLPTTKDVLDKISSEIDNFNDIDDDELEGFLLTAEESALKERVWVGINEEFLLEEERKRLKSQADEVSGHTQAKRRRTKPKSEAQTLNGINQDGIEGALNDIGESASSSAFSAAKNLLARKTQSKKINYLALNNLFDEGA